MPAAFWFKIAAIMNSSSIIRANPPCRVRARYGAAVAAWTPAIASAQATSEGVGVSAGALLQMLLSLLLIIALLFAGAWLLRRLNGGMSFGQNGPLRIVGGLMISPRERIVLVEVEDTWLVVGIVPGQIKTLHTLPKGEIQAPGGSEKSFSQWLKQIGERKKNELE